MHKALKLTISGDELSVTMTVLKEVLENQKELTYPGVPDVMAGLKELKITYGIAKDKISKNLKLKDTPITIAKGRPVVQTINDKVAYTFEDNSKKKFTPTLLADNKVDFYDMVQYKLVKPNELLVFIKKGRSGDNGLNVLGIELFPEKYNEMGVDILKKFVGPNTELTPNGIVSTITGIPSIDYSGKVSVNETFINQGDIDFNTGSIDFEGPVIVKGMITNNFSVKTPKDVIVEGLVDGGIIEAGGMVTVLGGVNKGKITCKKNLVAKYIYASDIVCNSTVITDEAILNSNILAKTIIARGEPTSSKSGQISGGKITASNFIWAKSIGSPSGNYTEQFIKSFIDRAPLETLTQEKVRYDTELAKIIRTIKLMEELKQKTSNLPPDFKINLLKLLKSKLALEKKTQQLKAQIDIFQKKIDQEDEESARKVFISVALYPKVLTQIFDKKVLTKADYGPTIISICKEDETIKLQPATGKMELPVGYGD